jgi:penicillin-binding protein 1A
LIPVLIVVVLGVLACLMALILLPLFGAAGTGVNAFRERLDEAGVGQVRIPVPPQSSTIYAADGTLLAEIYLDENRRLVKIAKVNETARNAVLAIEDDSFYTHGALDFPGLIRAAIKNLAAGEIEQGGSTLTQQLVKNVLIEAPEETFARKFQEAALAIRIERKYPKDRILEWYLNEVYFGNGAYGIQTAANTYFRSTAKELTLPQAALLAGLIQSPGTYDPVLHEDAALARRNQVLDRMAELGWADAAKVERAKLRPLGIAADVGVYKEKVEPFWIYFIRNLILENVDGEFDAFGATREQRVKTLYQGGLKIYTSIDPTWQEYAQEAVDASTYLDGTKKTPDTSLVSVRATDGAIKAMLSGKDYERDQIDLVWHGIRQTGSAFKPFTLVAAFEHDFPQGKVYSSKSPLCGLEGWISASGCVQNAEGGGDRGYLDLWGATQNSVNVVFAQLALDVGPEAIVDAAHRMGITVGLDAVPSITLGVEEVPTLDMASAYATLANDGIHCEPWAVRRVEFVSGPLDERLLYRHNAQCEQVIEPEIAHLVTAMLQRVVCCGTGRAAILPGRPVAGKTGTAQDATNVYFAGYTPQVATAVWVGFPNGQIPMPGDSVFGGTIAAPIWQDFMSRAMAGWPVEGFESPPAPESGSIPDVLGLPIEEAEAILVEANFTPVVEEVLSFEEKGTVLTQEPGGGTARLGSAVHLTVSDGKGEPVIVPRVVELTEADAIKQLTKLGLIADVQYVPVDEASLDGIVVDQIPIGDGNKMVDVGATVTIFVGEFKDGGGGDGGGGEDGGGGGDGEDGGGGGDGGGEGLLSALVEPLAVPGRRF